MRLFREAKRERASRLGPFDLDSASRVARGAALLDEKNPGWHEKIDTEILDIADPDRCILGQLYGGFVTGLDEHNMYPLTEQNRYLPFNHGFATELDTEEWVLLINKRQLARSA